MVKKDKLQNPAQRGTEGTRGTKEPNQSTAEFYSPENAPTIEDFTSGSQERDHRQEHADQQAAARDGGGDLGSQGSTETNVSESAKAPESSDVGSSLLNPSDPQAGRLGDRVDDLGLRPDHTSANVFDDAAEAGSGGSGGYGQMGNEGLMGAEGTGGAGYGAVYDSEEGLRSTGSKPSGDGLLHDLAEGFSRAFVPGESSYGPTNQEFRRLEQEESGGTGEGGTEGGTGSGTGGGTGSGTEGGTGSGTEGGTGGENEKSYTRKNADGTVDVVKGDKMYHWDPATNEVTETNTTTGEKTTTSPDDTPSLFGIPDDENAGGDLPPGFIDSEALLPPEMRTESILRNMTGAGQKGGEEVKPAPEGGTGQSGGTATDDPFRQTTEEMIGQPDPEATHHGGKAPGSAPTFGPGQEEIDPGEEGSLPSGETRSEDLPGGTTSSQDDSLGLEGGHDGQFDFSGAAEEIQDAQDPPQLPPRPPLHVEEDDDTATGGQQSFTGSQVQFQDKVNHPTEVLDTTDDDAGF